MSLTLSSISPKAGAAFSPNLHSFLRRNFKNSLDRVEIRPIKGKRRELYIGSFSPEHKRFHAVALNRVLAYGARAHMVSYSLESFRAPLANFWREYTRLGRCHIDQHHKMGFIDKQWDTAPNGKLRQCMWCGFMQKAELRRRVFTDKVWVPA